MLATEQRAKRKVERQEALPVSMRGWYSLNDDGTIEPCDMWGAESILNDVEHRRIGYTELEADGQRIVVSTVFLSLDHGFHGQSQLFETLVEHDGDEVMQRYSTVEQAKIGHNTIVIETAMKLSSESCHQFRTRFMEDRVYNPLEF